MASPLPLDANQMMEEAATAAERQVTEKVKDLVGSRATAPVACSSPQASGPM